MPKTTLSRFLVGLSKFTIRYDPEIGKLAQGERSNSNRTYVWRSVPSFLVGHFTRTAGGEFAQIVVQAKHDTTIKIATALSQPGINMGGWNQTTETFQYSDHKNTATTVFTRALKAGERVVVPQGN